jgi:hypothetical protein
VLQLGAAFVGGSMVARSAGAAPENVAVLIADKRRGAGLSVVDAQEIHGTWDCSAGRRSAGLSEAGTGAWRADQGVRRR